jgi:hypothetical protein
MRVVILNPRQRVKDLSSAAIALELPPQLAKKPRRFVGRGFSRDITSAVRQEL